MLLNSMQREEPYLGLTCTEISQRCGVPLASCTGGAWLSSARVVRCWVKSRNERNPRSMLPARDGGDSWETAGVNSEEGGDDVKSSCPLCLGLQTCYNGRSEEHTSELQSRQYLVCRLLLEKKKKHITS